MLFCRLWVLDYWSNVTTFRVFWLVEEGLGPIFLSCKELIAKRENEFEGAVFFFKYLPYILKVPWGWVVQPGDFFLTWIPADIFMAHVTVKISMLQARSYRMFHDDSMKSFFRRLSFTPDGSLLLTPGMWEEHMLWTALFILEACIKIAFQTSGGGLFIWMMPFLIYHLPLEGNRGFTIRFH